ncbi:anaerobic ribonucleoside-triphosphate reductase activating protein [Patescibacteria group bacterium]|nr:anaerobic ribonucleoside-triphosphate reductase activating protein [Patescibacteria group bacterium]
MVIAGFQNLSLIDYPGKCCSIVFTQGCVFRCPYCHNPELISTRPTTTISEESVLKYLVDNKKMLDGVCITGGEPTIQVGLRRFIEQVKEIGMSVKLDTNGVHPDLVQELLDAKLIDYLAMDLKHRWEKYETVARSGGSKTVEHCQRTFSIIQNSGIDHEFRTTVFPGGHTEEDFIEMVSYLKDGEKYFIQDTQFTKTLEKEMVQTKDFEVKELLEKLRVTYPNITIEMR